MSIRLCQKSEIASELFRSSNPDTLNRRVFCRLMFLTARAGNSVEFFFIRVVPEKQLLLKSLTRSTINTCQEVYFQVVIEKKLPQRYFP